MIQLPPYFISLATQMSLAGARGETVTRDSVVGAGLYLLKTGGLSLFGSEKSSSILRYFEAGEENRGAKKLHEALRGIDLWSAAAAYDQVTLNVAGIVFEGVRQFADPMHQGLPSAFSLTQSLGRDYHYDSLALAEMCEEVELKMNHTLGVRVRMEFEDLLGMAGSDDIEKELRVRVLNERGEFEFKPMPPTVGDFIDEYITLVRNARCSFH